MTDSLFEDICYNNFCHSCRHNKGECFPLGIDCPEQDSIHLLYNACWLADKAFDASCAFDDEDNPIAVVLGNCFSEQEDLCDALISRISEAVAV